MIKGSKRSVAKRRTNLTDDDVSSRLEPAKAAAINAIRTNANHLARFVAVRKIRENMFKHLPNLKKSPLDQPREFTSIWMLQAYYNKSGRR